MKHRVWFAFLILGLFSIKAFPKDVLQTGTSVSHFYDARSVFINPAALSYQTELNGKEILTAFSLGWREEQDDLALGLGWGNLGLGVERFLFNQEIINRYSLASAMAIGPWVYLGSRLAFVGSTPGLEGTTQVDLGVQIRPSSFFSLGGMVNRLNRPQQNGQILPMQYSVGMTLRPFEKLLLQLDWEGDNQYQGTAQLQLFRGLFLQGGYDKTAKAHFGLQLNLGGSSVISLARPSESHQVLVNHAQFSPLPRESSLQPPSSITITLDSSLKERGETGSFFSAPEESLAEKLWTIEEATHHPAMKTIHVIIDTFPLGMGAAAELHDSLWRARQEGKWIQVSLGSARLKEYLIASAAHSISLAPSGSIELVGPKSERYYLKGTLDQIGIEGEFIAKGAYKSAPETFTAKKASPKSKENIVQNLTEAEEEIKALILKSGKIDLKNWEQARKLGILSGEEALKLKLIDSVASSDQVKTQLSQKNLSIETPKLASDSLSLPPKIAVIVASGDIVREKIKLLGVFGGDQISPEKMKPQIERAKSDPTVKAVVIRISSGGGDVLASHLIANLVQDLKQTKPVVISMGDVAASGGYFISAPASSVFASPLTLTGSIGVFSGKPNLSELFKKIDLNKEIISLSPYPNLFSEATAWTKEEREIIERQVNQYYQAFIAYVSKNRDLPLDKVEQSAQGRVWLGRKAKQNQLIDELGGVVDAIYKAQSLAQLESFQIKWIYPSTNLLEEFSPFGEAKQSNTSFLKDLRLGLLSDEPFLYWTPENLQ